MSRQKPRSPGVMLRNREVVKSDVPAPLLPADEKLSCYSTTVMDYFEVVHERRSNGSCRCGEFPATI